MTQTYKLVVVSPFNDYKRGDEITDQEVVKNILDKDHEHHSFDAHVRRVQWTPPATPVIEPPVAIGVYTPVVSENLED
jgi:hypothetical protein